MLTENKIKVEIVKMLNIIIQMIKYYIPWNGFAHNYEFTQC